MNKKTIVASLAEIANELDKNNLYKEASDITKIMVKVAQQKADANQVVYNVLKRMTGRPDYNKMKNLASCALQQYILLFDFRIFVLKLSRQLFQQVLVHIQYFHSQQLT